MLTESRRDSALYKAYLTTGAEKIDFAIAYGYDQWETSYKKLYEIVEYSLRLSHYDDPEFYSQFFGAGFAINKVTRVAKKQIGVWCAAYLRWMYETRKARDTKCDLPPVVGCLLDGVNFSIYIADATLAPSPDTTGNPFSEVVSSLVLPRFRVLPVNLILNLETVGRG